MLYEDILKDKLTDRQKVFLSTVFMLEYFKQFNTEFTKEELTDNIKAVDEYLYEFEKGLDTNRYLNAEQGLKYAIDFIKWRTAEKGEKHGGIIENICKSIYEDVSPVSLSYKIPSDIIKIGTEIYLSKEYDNVNILGDILEEAGFIDLANHCHCGCKHYLGCYVVDYVYRCSKVNGNLS